MVIERFSDHSGRRQKNLALFTPVGLRRCSRYCLDRIAAIFTGKGVGIARIDNKKPGRRRLALFQIGAAPLDDGGSCGRLCENPGDCCSGCQLEYRQIRAALVALARARRYGFDACDGTQGREFFRC